MPDETTRSWDAAISDYLRTVSERPEPPAPAAPEGLIGPASPPVLRSAEADPSHPDSGGVAPWPDIERPTDPLDAIEEALAERHAESPFRRGARALRSMVRSDSIPESVARAATLVQQPVTTGRRIVVVGTEGGCGTTTVAAGVAALTSAWRHDHVAVVAGRPDDDRLAERLTQHVVVAPSDLLAGGDSPGNRRRGGGLLVVRHPEVDRAVLPLPALVLWLCRTRAVTLVDAGTAPSPDLLGDAHAVVVVTSPTVDGIKRAREATRMSAGPTVVVVSDTGRPTGVSLAEACGLVTADHVLPLPLDRHLAGGVVVDLGRLGEGTRAALADISATALGVASARLDGPLR